MATSIKSCGNCNRIFETGEDLLRSTSGWRICENNSLWFECACGSTLMIPKGKYDWYSPAKQMSGTAASLFNTLPHIRNLPHVSEHFMRMQQIARDPNIDIHEFAAVLRRDPILASNVLKMAGAISAARGETKSATSLEHCIVFLGRGYVSYLIMTTAVQTFQVSTRHFSVESHRQKAYLTGVIAETLGARLGLDYMKDELYISGALCNMGKLVSAMLFPEQADALALATKNSRSAMSWVGLEAKLKTHPHTTLGEIAAVLWGLPKYVVHSCANHHLSPSAQANAEVHDRVRTQLIVLSNQLMHWLLHEPERIDAQLLKESAEFFKLDEAALEVITKELQPTASSIVTPTQAT